LRERKHAVEEDVEVRLNPKRMRAATSAADQYAVRSAAATVRAEA
jgi:hypothetical protein